MLPRLHRHYPDLLTAAATLGAAVGLVVLEVASRFRGYR